jgi:hypothetical protein
MFGYAWKCPAYVLYVPVAVACGSAKARTLPPPLTFGVVSRVEISRASVVGELPTPTFPVDEMRTRCAPAVAIAMVSAAGKYKPVSAVPVADTIAGAALDPADTVTTPVNVGLSLVAAPMSAGAIVPEPADKVHADPDQT